MEHGTATKIQGIRWQMKTRKCVASKGQAPIKIVSILVVIGLGVGCRGDGRGVKITVSGTSGLCSGESQ